MVRPYSEDLRERALLRYDAGETSAVLASGAIMGETVPPSIAMLVLASVTSLSIGTLFVAGLLPAAINLPSRLKATE